LTGFYFKKNYFKNFISSQTQNTKIKMGTPGKGKKPGAPYNSPVEGKERKTTEENFQLSYSGIGPSSSGSPYAESIGLSQMVHSNVGPS